MKTTKEVQVGFFAIFTLMLLYTGGLFMKGRGVLSTHHTYYVMYPHSKGIIPSSDVTVNGHKVGGVKQVKIMSEKNFATLITFEVEKDVPLTEKSTVTLLSQWPLGGSSLEINIHPGKIIPAHSTLPGTVHSSLDNDMQDITNQVKMITTTLAKTTVEINEVMGSLKKTSIAFKKTIALNQDNLSTLSTNLATVSYSLVDKKNGLGAVITAGNRFFRDIERMNLMNLAKKTNQALTKMNVLLYYANSKKSNLGLLLHDDGLYTNLNHTLITLDSLLVDFKKRPSAYINLSLFGNRKHTTSKP